MAQDISYVPAREIEQIADCAFYHFMDLPGVGTVGDHWDLRPTIDDYLGHFDFVESCEQSRVVLSLDQALGQRPAQSTHRHNFLLAIGSRCYRF